MKLIIEVDVKKWIQKKVNKTNFIFKKKLKTFFYILNILCKEKVFREKWSGNC